MQNSWKGVTDGGRKKNNLPDRGNKTQGTDGSFHEHCGLLVGSMSPTLTY